MASVTRRGWSTTDGKVLLSRGRLWGASWLLSLALGSNACGEPTGKTTNDFSASTSVQTSVSPEPCPQGQTAGSSCPGQLSDLRSSRQNPRNIHCTGNSSDLGAAVAQQPILAPTQSSCNCSSKDWNQESMDLQLNKKTQKAPKKSNKKNFQNKNNPKPKISPPNTKGYFTVA